MNALIQALNKMEMPKKKKPRKRKINKKKGYIYKPIITCYTDGSYSWKDDVGGYCAYLECNGYSLMISGSEHQTTNNRMELMALLESLRIVKVPSTFIVYSDSQYVVNAIRFNWIEMWKKNHWHTKSGTPVANVDIWKQILKLLQFHDVQINWVRGHSGTLGNELCDEVSSMQMKNLRHLLR